MVTRAEIIAKMNYTMESADVPDYGLGFNAGLRDILGTALTKDLRTTDWYAFFDEKRFFDYRWYLRCDRRSGAEDHAPDVRERILASVDLIEATYPEILEVELDNRFWGELAGKHAAIRWLGDVRLVGFQCAEDWFPCLDT